MKTLELVNSILKGNEVAVMSGKQYSWLTSLARKEGLLVQTESYTKIQGEDCHYDIRNCRTTVHIGGGNLSKSIVPDKFRIEKRYLVKFKDTGLTTIARDYDLRHYKEQGYTYDIVDYIEME